MLIFGTLHLIALALGVRPLRACSCARSPTQACQPPDEDDGGGGGNDRCRAPPKPSPSGGLPLPDAVPPHGAPALATSACADLTPGRARRPAREPAPHAAPRPRC